MKKVIFLICIALCAGKLKANDCELPTTYENGSTGANMTILLHSSFLQTLNLTGYSPYVVAMVEPNDLVVGSSCLAEECLSDGMQSIAVWGDDVMTPEKDGAYEGDEITLKIIDGSDLYIVNVGSVTYTTNGMFLVSLGTIEYECTGVVEGCTDEDACNYNIEATVDDGSCINPVEYYDCDGNCLNDTDGDGVCDELEIAGCLEPMACNYNPLATDPDTCLYPQQYYDCNGECINDEDEDGICDELELEGCTHYFACNYNPEATEDDSSCVIINAEIVYSEQEQILTVLTNHDSLEITWLYQDFVIPFEHNDTLSILEDGVYEVVVFDPINDCGASDTVHVNVVGIEDDMMGSCNVYPNPTRDYITINTPINVEEIQIVNLNGQLLYKERISNNSKISVRDYPNGMYFLKVVRDDKHYVYPWVKE